MTDSINPEGWARFNYTPLIARLMSHQGDRSLR